MVQSVFTFLARKDFSFLWHLSGMDFREFGPPAASAPALPYLADPREVRDAAELMSNYGENAGCEAAARADHYRDLGNHIYFCRWRQIERLIVLLSIGRAVGTVH